MSTFSLQTKSMELKRLSNGEEFTLTAGYVYQDGKNFGFAIIVNGSGIELMDSYEEFYRGNTEKFGPEFWDRLFWKTDHESLKTVECGELNDVVDELVSEVNTGVNQYYIDKEEELCYFDIIY